MDMLELDSPSSSVAGTPQRKPINRKRKLPEAVKELATKELTQGYCVLSELLKGHKTFFFPPDSNAKNMVDYYEVVKEPMWMDEMRRRFESGEYKELSQFAADMRLLLENCYRFFGPNNITTKRAMKLEHTYIQCILLLPREIQSQCSLLPGGVINDTDGENEEYSSELLKKIIEEQRKEDEEHQRRVAEEVSLAEEDKDIIRWEREVLVTKDNERQIKSMWELPLIGQFVYLALDALNIDEMSMYEVERMLLMPQASQALARLVTSLLVAPVLRQRLVRLPAMSYHTWSRRLAQRVASWYKTYFKNDCNALKTFEATGVETEFWKILGESNPLEENEFHELSFHQRVWVLKSLCDYCLHNQSMVQDTVGTPEVRDTYKHKLGHDHDDFQYEHLPELCGDDLRVYRQAANSMSLIERDEVYREGVTAKTLLQQAEDIMAWIEDKDDEVTKDSNCSDTCTGDSKNVEKRKSRAKSTESDSGLSSNSWDTRQCDDSSNEQIRASSSTILARHDYVKSQKHIYNPHWLRPEDSGFEIVADSYGALNELIVRLGGDTCNQRLCNVKNLKKKIPKCEADLVRELQVLASNLKRFEVEFIACMKKARERMYKEWQEYEKRTSDFVDPSDAVWSLSGDHHDMVDEKCEDKMENPVEAVEEIVTTVKENHSEEIPEHKSEESEGRERYSRRAKRKVDIGHIQKVMSDDVLLMQDSLSDDLQLELLGSDMEDYEEEIEDDDDDVWEMPSKKKKISKSKTPGRKRKPGVLDTVLSDGSEITPKTTKKSSVKKIANTSNSKVKKNASRKLFCNGNPSASDSGNNMLAASPEVVNANTCEKQQDKLMSATPQKPPFSTASVKTEVDVPPCTEPTGWQGNAGNLQVKQDCEVKQEIKEEPQSTIKQESIPVVDSSVRPDTNVEFHPNSMSMFVYQSPQVNTIAAGSSVIIAPIITSVPFSSPNAAVPLTSVSQVQAPTSISQMQTTVPVSQQPMTVPTSQVLTQASLVEPPVRRTVLQRAGPPPVISSDVICLDSDSSDSDVELVEDVTIQPNPAVSKSPMPKPATSNPTVTVTPGKISFVPEHMLKNEVTPPKNLNHPLNTLKKALDKRLNVTISGETPKEVGQRLPSFTVQQQYQTVPNTPPVQILPGTGNIHVRNITPNRSLPVQNLQSVSPNTPKHSIFGKGTDVLSSMLSTPKKQPTVYPTTPRNTIPPAFSNSPRGGSPATFSPSSVQWNSPRGQYSPRPMTRGRGSYSARQTTPVRGQSVAARGRASPIQPVTNSPGPRARFGQQDNPATLSGSLPIVGDVDHTTGSFRYALVMSNGSRIPLTPEQVDQIRRGNGGMLPSSL